MSENHVYVLDQDNRDKETRHQCYWSASWPAVLRHQKTDWKNPTNQSELMDKLPILDDLNWNVSITFLNSTLDSFFSVYVGLSACIVWLRGTFVLCVTC